MWLWENRKKYDLEELIKALHDPQKADEAGAYLFGEAKKTYPALKSKFRSIGHDDLEDIFQEAVIDLIRQVKNAALQDLKSLPAYFSRIFSNKCINMQRKRATKEGKLRFPVRFELSQLPSLSEESYEKILQKIEEKQDQLQLLEKFRTEFPACYKLYYMRYFQEMSVGEIAKEMEYSSERVVSARISQCKQKIKARINWNRDER